MLARILRLVAAAWLAVSLPAGADAADPAPQSTPPRSLREILALPADNVRDALDYEYRTAEDRKRDKAEKVEDVLRASGIARGMRVVDLDAGDGYFAQILVFAVRRNGKVWGHSDPTDGVTAGAWKTRLQNPGGADIAEIRSPLGEPLPPYVERIDIVFSRGASHAAIARKVDTAAMQRAVFAALSPGGRYVVVDARAASDRDAAAAAALCRASEESVKNEVGAAGFRLLADSTALRNKNDAATRSACGNASADRFLLVFEKPLDAAQTPPP